MRNAESATANADRGGSARSPVSLGTFSVEDEDGNPIEVSIPDPDPIPYELKIGVTGHCELENEHAIEDAAVRLLGHIQSTLANATARPTGPQASRLSIQKWIERSICRVVNAVFGVVPMLPSPVIPVSPRTTPADRLTPIRWRLVTPLAQGADQIMARAMKRLVEFRIEAVLPFSVEEFRKDFSAKAEAGRDKATLVEFDEWYGARSFETVALNAPIDSAEAREEGYKRAGHEVIYESELVVAIWDGRPARGEGGTGEIVRRALEHERPVLWIHAERPEDPVYRLVLKAEGGKSRRVPDLMEGFDVAPLPTNAKELAYNYHQLCAFNRDPAFQSGPYRREYRDQYQKIWKAALAMDFPTARLSHALERVLPHLARSHGIAKRYQTLHKASAIAIFVMVASAISIATLQALFAYEKFQYIGLECILMFFTFILLWMTREEAWHLKWLHDRHFAERTRCLLFMEILGDPSAKSEAQPDETMPFYRGPDDWVDTAMDYLEELGTGSTYRDEEYNSLKNFLLAAWVNGQIEYHAARATQRKVFPRRAHRVGLALVILTFAGALCHTLGIGHVSLDEIGVARETLGLWIIAATIVFPVWGLALRGIDDRLDYERLSRRHENMRRVLLHGADEIRHALSPKEIHQTMRRIYRIMSTENHEWVVALSFRKAEMT